MAFQESPNAGATRYLSLGVFIAVVLGGGLLIGLVNTPGDWYASLVKPSFNPPNWLFGPVWSALYVLIAFAGWRTWRRNRDGIAMKVWFAQLGLNFLWPPVFFGAHLLGAGLLVIATLFMMILGFISLSWLRDHAAAWAFLPYAAWVAFATLLNAALWWLN